VQSIIKICGARKILAAICAFGACFAATVGAHSEPAAVTGTTAAQINACALLSTAAVSQATGFPAHSGSRHDSGYESDGSYSSTCVWTLERENSGTDRTAALGGQSFVILNVMQWPEGSGLAQSFLQAFHEAAATGEIPGEPTPRDLGDAALWWGDGLAVRKGDVSFGIAVVMPGTEADVPGEPEAQLAAQILRRLEHRTE